MIYSILFGKNIQEDNCIYFLWKPFKLLCFESDKINTVRKEARETVWINMYILSQSVGIYVNECKSSASELLWKPGERERGSEKNNNTES